MCKQRTALDMIKAQGGHCGLSDSALLLHEKQCEDFEVMQKEINEIKKDLSVVKDTQVELKEAQEETNKKIDELMSIVACKSSFFSNLKDIFNNKIFIYLLITLLTAAFGVSVGEVGIFLFK